MDGQMYQQSPLPRGQPSGTDLAMAFAKKAWAAPSVRRLTLMWLVGLFLMLLAPAPIKVTDEMKHTYEAMVVEAAHVEGYQDVWSEVVVAQSDLQEAKVWFWRVRPEHRRVVNEKQAIVDSAQAKLDVLDAAREETMRQAKAYVGLWSDYGLDEARAKFWSAFESGKVFASRRTFWQMLFTVLDSREENVYGLVIQWIFVSIINFTFGLIGSLFYFTFAVISMVFTYQPDPLSATAFVCLALLAAASLVATYLLGIYAMAAGAVYGVGKMAANSARLEHERRSRLRGAHMHDD
ncbi:hypothetical protein SDRG_12264 [Saprolegnia diclina VS20]|uniref:Uncharacterized protein n=1 Tax=Saprolegnia diclina (strain VS20) TaxID=1156394 RepID=T0PWW8_SAPDV|nr:hypothetical protein SDRG_12264 [Saprolegnia diclina VS20]EQC29984.1 hypothetical protein SDRG_12264 [Saprolegnia diclina VS20]|eukprot:XP_008616551.1 hypothetical protein SDRG_12264 [Saprolegnia diclina VS20]